MNFVKLSILIPTYNYKNGLNKILECLKNINHNLLGFLEIIISDDSEKRILSPKEYKNLKKKFINFKYIHNKKQLGGPQNWNNLISLAKGQYIWILHHDEYWEKDSNLIKNIFDVIKKSNPNVIVLPIKKSKVFFIRGKRLEIIQKHKLIKNIYKRFINNPKLLLRLNIIGPPSTLIYKKKEVFYDLNLSYLVDVEYYMRLFKRFNYRKIIIFSQNSYSLTSSQNNTFAITNNIKKDIKKIKKFENFYLSRKLKLEYNFIENIFLSYTYFILKFYSLFSIKIIID